MKKTFRSIVAPLVALIALASLPAVAGPPTPIDVRPREQGSATGNLTASSTDCSTANSCVTLTVNGASTFAVNLAGFGSATVQFEGSIDASTTWVAVKALPAAGGALVTSATGNGQWLINGSGFRAVRTRASAYSSGTIVAWINASSGPIPNALSAPTGVAGTAAAAVSSVQGPTAAGTAIAANPVTVGAVGATYGSSPTAAVAGAASNLISDLSGKLYVNTGHPRAVHCEVSTTATTSTQVTGCEVVASNSIYITSLSISGDIASTTANAATIQSGTSTGCSGPHVLFECYHPALGTCTYYPATPIKVTQAEGLCILDGVTGTKKAVIDGYVAP